jgi:hypothetical protein
MSTIPSLTSAQAGQLLNFYKSSVPGKTTYLDPSNPDQRAVIETMLQAAGRTGSAYPHLYQALSTNGAYKGSPDLDKVQMVDAGRTVSGNATASVWSCSGGQTLINGGNLMVFDSESGNLLAQGENAAVSNGFLACPTRAATAAPAAKNLSLLYLGHTTDTDGSTRFYSYSDEAQVADEPMDGIQANIIQPVITPGSTNTDIEIAVARTTGHPPPAGMDYIYYEASNEPDPYAFPIVPFVGNVALSGSINIAGLTIANLSTSLFFNNSAGVSQEVGRAVQYTTDADMIAACSVGSAPNILQWSFPYDGNTGKGFQTTKSIVYNMNNMIREIDSYFYFAFTNIPFTDGSVSAPFYVCSYGSPEEGSVNCKQIPNLYFWWHCVAKGTMITLADGTLKPIEEVNETFRVKTPGGSSLAVWATVVGRHQSDPAKGENDIYSLTTENGKTLTATEEHMLFLSSGTYRRIRDIVVGDTLETEDGPSKVKSNQSVAGDEMFYNLALGNAEEKKGADFPHGMAGFYANGILSGDQEAMRKNIRAIYSDLDYMLPRIQESLHQDYTSAVQQKRF